MYYGLNFVVSSEYLCNSTRANSSAKILYINNIFKFGKV